MVFSNSSCLCTYSTLSIFHLSFRDYLLPSRELDRPGPLIFLRRQQMVWEEVQAKRKRRRWAESSKLVLAMESTKAGWGLRDGGTNCWMPIQTCLSGSTRYLWHSDHIHQLWEIKYSHLQPSHLSVSVGIQMILFDYEHSG